MKALILAGGRGKRLNECSDSQNKCMLRLGGKPIIEFGLDCAANIAEIDEIIVVVGYQAEKIINNYGIGYKGKRIRYVIQLEQRGLVHAIECSKDALGNDDFMLLLGDEILANPRHRQMIDEFEREHLFGVCGVVAAEDRNRIHRTYAIIQGDEDRIYRLIEKPRKPLNEWMGTGNCVFRNAILSYIDRTPINQERGEKELPDLIQCAVDEGNAVMSFVICDWYTNINSLDDLREAEVYFGLQAAS